MPENVLMTVDTTGFMSVEWETDTGLMLAMSEKKKKKVVGPTESADNNNNNSDTIQHIDVRNVEDNRPLFRLKLIQRCSPHNNHHHTP
ncbi:hypothetical protein Pelo_19951 [Pelomyxa schiedti]|nr:hypothetical protein Pelo_19951 [Pelomyxa schiedti]